MCVSCVAPRTSMLVPACGALRDLKPGFSEVVTCPAVQRNPGEPCSCAAPKTCRGGFETRPLRARHPACPDEGRERSATMPFPHGNRAVSISVSGRGVEGSLLDFPSGQDFHEARFLLGDSGKVTVGQRRDALRTFALASRLPRGDGKLLRATAAALPLGSMQVHARRTGNHCDGVFVYVCRRTPVKTFVAFTI